MVRVAEQLLLLLLLLLSPHQRKTSVQVHSHYDVINMHGAPALLPGCFAGAYCCHTDHPYLPPTG
jgi:hypothetical protein